MLTSHFLSSLRNLEEKIYDYILYLCLLTGVVVKPYENCQIFSSEGEFNSKGGDQALTSPIPEVSKKDIVAAHEEFWAWVFRENDGDNHPLKRSSGNQTAQIQRGSLLILAGSFPDDKPKNRLLQIPDGVDNIFVPAENCIYTDADGDGSTDEELKKKANKDMEDSKAKVWINEDELKPTRLDAHAFSLDIQRCIVGAGHSGKGEGQSCINGNPPRETLAAAACDYAIISANSLKSGDEIKVEGIGRVGPNKKPGDIKITYKVQS